MPANPDLNGAAGAVAETDAEREARAFAESVAGVLRRHQPATPADWAPGGRRADHWPQLTAALDEIGWATVAGDPELVGFAGRGGVELGRHLAPLHELDRLLGGAPIAGDLVRCLGPDTEVVARDGGAPARRPAVRAQPCPSADGLDVHRVGQLGTATPIDARAWEIALDAWLAASVGYLAGLGAGATELTVDYVRQRRAFGSTLAGLAPVQQLLAGAATAVRGVTLLAASAPDADALAHAGPAVAEACAACQQVTGAIGYTLEYPLHHFTQRAKALSVWNEALLDALIG